MREVDLSPQCTIHEHTFCGGREPTGNAFRRRAETKPIAKIVLMTFSGWPAR